MQVFLDSSAIIFAFDFEESNSALILDLILDKKIEAITCEKVLIEVRNYFSNLTLPLTKRENFNQIALT